MKRSIRISLFLFLIVCLSVSAAAGQRVFMLSWDGAPDWIVDKLLAEGDLPSLARIAQNGVRADYTISSYPSKTAVAHAAVWTGTWLNGVAGNWMPAVPRDKHCLTEMQLGFSGERLLAEPVWITACRNGKHAAILTGPHCGPCEVFQFQLKESNTPEDRLFMLAHFDKISDPRFYTDASGFKPVPLPASFPAYAGKVKGLNLTIGKAAFTAYIFDSPTDPVTGYDSAFIIDNDTSEAAVLKPGLSTPGTIDKFSPVMEVKSEGKTGYARFRLFNLSPDGNSIILFQSGSYASLSSQLKAANTILKAMGGTAALPFTQYKQGMFGKPVIDGGDGTAEKYLAEMFRFHADGIEKSAISAIKNVKWDILTSYNDLIDSVEHQWVGAVDPDNPFCDQKKAATFWPLIKEAYQINDASLGRIYDALPKDANLVLFSDHGMEGGTRIVYVNRILEKAGLLKFKENKEIDLASSKAMALSDGVSIYINLAGRNKDGIVPLDEKAKVLDSVKSALLSEVDPANGLHPVSKVFDANDAGVFGVGSSWAPDLMADPSPGYSLSASAPNSEDVYKNEEPIGFGAHANYPHRRHLQGIFYAVGPGTAKGKTIPALRLIDIAPTVCKMVGIPAPKDASGTAVTEVIGVR